MKTLQAWFQHFIGGCRDLLCMQNKQSWCKVGASIDLDPVMTFLWVLIHSQQLVLSWKRELNWTLWRSQIKTQSNIKNQFKTMLYSCVFSKYLQIEYY